MVQPVEPSVRLVQRAREFSRVGAYGIEQVNNVTCWIPVVGWGPGLATVGIGAGRLARAVPHVLARHPERSRMLYDGLFTVAAGLSAFDTSLGLALQAAIVGAESLHHGDARSGPNTIVGRDAMSGSASTP